MTWCPYEWHDIMNFIKPSQPAKFSQEQYICKHKASVIHEILGILPNNTRHGIFSVCNNTRHGIFSICKFPVGRWSGHGGSDRSLLAFSCGWIIDIRIYETNRPDLLSCYGNTICYGSTFCYGNTHTHTHLYTLYTMIFRMTRYQTRHWRNAVGYSL